MEGHDLLRSTMQESAQYIKSIVNSIPNLSKVAINIGANDGITLDLMYPLFLEEGFDGICIEGDPEIFQRFKSNIPTKVQ